MSGVPLRLLLGGDALRPEDVPEFGPGCQAHRQRRIEELQIELSELTHEVLVQDCIDAAVERVLQLSFEEEPYA